MKRKIPVLILVILAIMTVVTSQVFANTFEGRYNTGNLTYAFAGNYTSSQQDQLAAYFKQWDNATSQITMSKGSTYSGSKLRIRYKLTDPPYEGWLGYTYLYDANGDLLDGTTGTWYKATCSIYITDLTDETGKKATLVHEVGHAVSMAHCTYNIGHSGLTHIMHQGIKYYTTVSNYEKDELTDKWGN